MTSETLLPLADPAPRALPPAYPGLRGDASAGATRSDNTARPSPTLQERRLRAARELDLRIRHLEQETATLGNALELARRHSGEQLRELQQRSTSLTTEVLRLGARLARQGRQQEDGGRLLAQRLQELETALAPLRDSLQQQALHLRELQERHDRLACLHEHLERIVSRQGRGLDIVAAEFEQRVELLRVSLEGVQALFREQQASQVRMAVEQEALSVVAQTLQARMDDLRDDLQRQREDTRRQVRTLGNLLAALAVLTLGLLGWCQLHPLALPPAAAQRLAALETGAARERAQAAAAMSREETRLQQLRQDLQQLRRDRLRLDERAERQQVELRRLHKRLAALVAATPAAAAAPPAPRESAPAPQDTDMQPTGWRQGKGPIELPPAFAGSRADF